MTPAEPCMVTDLFMERMRRAAESMPRDELLVMVHQLTHAYSMQRAATIWAVNQAAANLNYGRPT